MQELPIEFSDVPPWLTGRLFTVLAMLQFGAKPFVTATFTIAQVIQILDRGGLLSQESAKALGSALGELMRECEKLDLPMTMIQLQRMEADIVDESRPLDARMIRQQMLELMNRFTDELSTSAVCKVESTKAIYIDPGWLANTALYGQYPKAWKELQRAGHCYAYGENTACAFHLNRALEWGLKSLAVHLGKTFDRNSWDAHLKDIEKELQARYAAAGPRTPDEKFYSETAAQFGHMKVAWRNPTMHIEASYDDSEGLYLLTTTEKFMQHLASKGLKE